MTTQIKAISLRATYGGNLDGLRRDIQTLKSVRRSLEKQAIRIPVKLDLSSLRSEAAKAAAEIKRQVSAAMGTISPGSGVSKGGLIIPAGAMAELSKASAAAGKEIKRVTDLAADGSIKAVRSIQQVENGLQRIERLRKVKGKTVLDSSLIDTRPVEKFRKAIDQLGRNYAGKIGRTRGSGGNMAGVLARQREDLEREIKRFADLNGTPEMRRANKMLDTLTKQIAQAESGGKAKDVRNFRSVSGSLDRQRDKELRSELASKLRAAREFRSVSAALDRQRNREIANQEKAKAAEIGRMRSVGSALDRQRNKEIAAEEKSKAAEINRMRSVGSSLDRQRDKEQRKQIAAKLREDRQFRSVSAALDRQRNREIASQEKAKAAEIGRMRAIGSALDRQRDKELRSQVAAKLREERQFRSVSGSLDRQRDREISKQEKSKAQEQARFRAVSGALDRQRDREIRRQTSQEQIRSKNAAQRLIKREDRGLEGRIRSNREDESRASTILNRTTREARLNQVLNDRERLLEAQAVRYEGLATAARAAGKETAAEKFEDAGRRTRKDLGNAQLYRSQANDAARIQADARALAQRFENAKRNLAIDRERINTMEQQARAIKNVSAKEAALQNVLRRRASLQTRAGREFSTIRNIAAGRGDDRLVKRVDDAAGTMARQGERDLRRLTAATRASGHAFDFHTGSLLKNAATFTRWYIPAQAAMGAFNAIGRGARNAVEAQRTFAVLNAVFRGSREDAARLADETLILAAANGRGADEAAQAAVTWSRLGLTRVQVLTALETSLRAANVAEISAADATKFLAASYKALDLSISDLPALLDYLNSLSNQYGVTVEDLFQGLSRSAAVAKQAGVSYQQLGAIIATVADRTARPGAEIGNSIKSTLNRIGRPEIQEQLKLDFGIDALDASGALKPSFEILKQLGALYPQLNTAEKARLTNLVAGSLQSNRFTVVLENFTDVLIAQAKAGLDANSAQRENAEILSTLDAQLKSVGTSWTQLLYTIGETGAFDTAAAALKNLGTALKFLSGGVGGTDGTDVFRPEDISTRFLLTRAANTKGSGPFDLPDTQFTGPQIRAAEANLQAIKRLKELGAEGKGLGDAEVKEITSFLSKSSANLSVVPANLGLGARGERGLVFPNGSFDNFFEPDSFIKDIQDIRQNFERGQRGNVATSLGTRVVQRQTAANSLAAGQFAFEALARDAGSTDKGRLLKQFETASPVLSQLPGGFANVADAELQVRPLIERGDIAGASAALAVYAQRLQQAANAELAGAEQDRAAAIKSTTEALEDNRKVATELYEKLAKPKVADQEKLKADLEAVNALLKDQAETLRGLQQDTTLPSPDPLSGSRGPNLDRYFQDLKAAGEAFDQFVQGLDTAAFPDLSAKLRLDAGRFQIDSIRESYDKTLSGLADRKPGIESGISRAEEDSRFLRESARITAEELGGRSDPAAEASIADSMAQANAADATARSLRDQLAMHDAIAARLETEADKMEEALLIAERKIEIEREFARLNDAFSGGSTFAGASAGRFAVGRTEGERLVNTQTGVMNALNGGNVIGSISDPWLGAGDAAQDAREAGIITGNLAAAKQGLINIETRYNTALADRANLENTITDELRKQREEASKKLALASREDQLRSAAAAAVLRSRGQSQFSLQEFQYFSEGTRGALANLNPQSVNGLDDTDRENTRRRSELDGEIRLLASSLRTMREEFENARPYAEEQAGNLLNPKNLFPGRTGDAPDIANGIQAPRVNLSVGNVDIRVDFDRHIEHLRRTLQSSFDEKIDAALSRLQRNSGPNTQPAASTF